MKMFVVMHRTGEYELVFHEPVAAFTEERSAQEFILSQVPKRESSRKHHPEMTWDMEDWYVEGPIELDPADSLPGS